MYGRILYLSPVEPPADLYCSSTDAPNGFLSLAVVSSMTSATSIVAKPYSLPSMI